MKITKASGLSGEVMIPGDKSISHRAVMFGALGEGLTEVTHFLQGADCLSTIECFRRMGIAIRNEGDRVLVEGKGLHGLSAPSLTLDVGNSIRTRPMKRIMEPLTQMGADIRSQQDNGCAPLLINGRPLHGIHYTSKVASAQVKSCILLAGMYADAPTSVTEPSVSRNHSELMLNYFGAQVDTSGTTATIQPEPHLIGQKVEVPGDISSAAYFIVAGLIVPNTEILIKNVGINPTRDGILRVVQAMGGKLELLNASSDNGEPSADLLVRSSSLHGTVIEGDLIPTLIDELPVIAVLACFAEGTTVIKDAQELKVKESNRIDAMADNLTRMGAHVTATDDGLIIEGGHSLHGATIDSRKDHRIAMSFAVAALAADGETEIQDAECVNISYPEFYEDLRRLTR